MTDVCGDDPLVSVTLAWGDPVEQLIIPPDCTGPGVWWNELAYPDFSMRYRTAPPSDYVGGDVLLAAVVDSSTIPMRVAVAGESVADVEARKAVLTSALRQWTLTVSVSADDGTGPVILNDGPWKARPTLPVWGAITPARVGLLVAEAVVQIPVNPAGV